MLAISGHSFSLFGKYFGSQRNHKTREEFMRFLLAHCWLIAGSLLSMLLANDQLGSHFGSQSAVGTLDSGDTTWHWLVRRQKLTLSCLDSCGARWRTSFFTFLSRFRSKMDPCCLVHEKRKKFSWKSYSKPWKASHLSVFVWIVTLTVAFCDGVSRNSKFSWVVRTSFFVLKSNGGFFGNKKR